MLLEDSPEQVAMVVRGSHLAVEMMQLNYLNPELAKEYGESCMCQK